MALPEVVTALVTVLEDVTGITTVLPDPPAADPDEADLPLLFLIVRAASSLSDDGSTGGWMDNRVLVWPIEIVLFHAVKGTDRGADLSAVYPFPERIVAALDANLTLLNTLDGAIQWPDPIMDDPGFLGFDKKTYSGFTLLPRFPIRLATGYAP